MLLSRFWFVFLGLLLGVASFVLLLGTGMYNRAGAKAMAEGLSADSQVVAWYLQSDARQRSAQLIQFALDPEIQKNLDLATKAEEKIPDKVREKLGEALRRVSSSLPVEFGFDEVYAIDQHGRVVAQTHCEQKTQKSPWFCQTAVVDEEFELGGYPVVADALHGFIRDDTLVLDRIYRVVARPVEFELGQMPAGAIVGGRIMDDRFARELSERTNAAVAFFTRGMRVASGAPEGFPMTEMDRITSDMQTLELDLDYLQKGRSGVRLLGDRVGVVYARLPGEAWALGAGYAVGRVAPHVKNPFDFFQQADDLDKRNVPIWVVVVVALAAALLGILFSVLEHTRPLRVFRHEAARLARGEVDQLFLSRFRGVYRKIALDLNEGIDKVARKGGIPRRAADLSQVLGDLPPEPKMSAFALPGDGAAPASAAGAPSESKPAPLPAVPEPARARALPSAPGPVRPVPSQSEPEVTPPGPPAPPRRAPPPPVRRTEPEDPKLAEWKQVYRDYVATKQRCGEPTEDLTYEKFEQTLRKHEEALTKRHGATRVKFSVYVRDGKAALKASPTRD